jgi:hypothetical protein
MKRRGFITMDIIFAIGIAMLLLMLMTATVIKQRKAEKGLSAMRTAVRNVEEALLALQTGGEVPPTVKVEALDGKAPAGYRWVRVSMPPSERLPPSSLVRLIKTAARSVEGQAQ